MQNGQQRRLIEAVGLVLAALGVVRLTGWNAADPVFALMISGYMLFNASHIARDALAQLLDRELPRAGRSLGVAPGDHLNQA